MLTVDSKSVFSLKPSNIKTPAKSQTLRDCSDLSIHEKISEVSERKSNNVEQQYYFEPSTILFNYFFEEIISLRSYVNEQLENVKKSQYNSKESAKCNHSTRTDELQHLREESRPKTEIIKMLPGNIFLGNNVKKKLSLGLARNIISKLTKGSVTRKQVTIWYYKAALKPLTWKEISRRMSYQPVEKSIKSIKHFWKSKI